METREKAIKILSVFTEICILAIVFLVPTYFSFFRTNYHIFEVNKLLVFHFFLFAGIAAFWAKALVSGRLEYRFNPKIILFALLVALAYFISSWLAPHPGTALWGSYIRQQGFYALASYLAFFLLLIFCLEDWRQVKRILIAVVAGGFVVSVYGLVQQYGYDPIGWQENAQYLGRIFSTLGQPNYLGQYLVMVLPLSVFTAAIIASGKNFFFRFFALLIVALELAALFFSLSRSAWFGLAAGSVTALFYFLLYKRRRKTIIAIAAVCVLLVASIVAANLRPNRRIDYGQTDLVNRLSSGLYLRGMPVNQMRLYTWQAAWSELKSAPAKRLLLGFGPDNLLDPFVRHYRPDWGVYEKINTFPDRAHNLILDGLLQFGLVGASISFVYFFWIAGIAIRFFFRHGRNLPVERIWLAGALLAAAAGFLVSDLFAFPMTVSRIYVYLILALMVFLASENAQRRELNLSWLKEDGRIAIAVISAAIIGIFFYSQDWRSYSADRYLMSAARADSYGDQKSLVVNLSLMADANPRRPFYRDQYALYSAKLLSTISEAGRRDLGKKIIDQLYSIDPAEYDYDLKNDLGSVYLALGEYYDRKYYREAEKIYSQLMGENRNIPLNYLGLARAQLRQNEAEKAIGTLIDGLKVLPPTTHPDLNPVHRKELEAAYANFYELLGQVYLGRKDRSNALKYYKSWLILDPENKKVKETIKTLSL